MWVLASYRAGENSQLVALAEALKRDLGLDYQVKRMRYRPWATAIGLARRVSHAGLDRVGSSPLQAPWPRLVITAGLRNEGPARWIRRQSNGSILNGSVLNSSTLVVYVGRCWAPAAAYDLVVTTPQYRSRPAPNLLVNDTTMQNANPARLRTAAESLLPLPAGIPTPRGATPAIAVLVGGHSGAYCFGPRAGAALGRALCRLARARHATLLISTSARTPEPAVTALEEALAASPEVPHQLYRWRPNDPDNPYFGYLGLAAEVVVTGDSIAMLSEACATGKPVHIFDLAGDYPTAGAPHHRRDHSLKSTAFALLAHGPRRLTRDLSQVHRHLIDTHHAQWLGDPIPDPLPPPPRDVARTVARIRRMLDGG